VYDRDHDDLTLEYLYDRLNVVNSSFYLRRKFDGTGNIIIARRNVPRLDSDYEQQHLTRHAATQDDKTDLLLRVYIPSERLYASEADKLLSLFRDWLIASHGHGIRQDGYRTASGQLYEFFADASMAKKDLRKELNDFSNFLTLCSADPSAAADMLSPMGLERAHSVDFVARFGREVRRLQIDLAHERERRILTIRSSSVDMR